MTHLSKREAPQHAPWAFGVASRPLFGGEV